MSYYRQELSTLMKKLDSPLIVLHSYNS